MRKFILSAILIAAAGSAQAVVPVRPLIYVADEPIVLLPPEDAPAPAAAAAVPESSSWAMLTLGFGLLGLGLRRRVKVGRAAA